MIEHLWLATGGSLPVGVIAVLALGAAGLYSIWIALTLVRSYLSATSVRSGGLALGLLLLTTVPITTRFGIGTLGDLSAGVISLIALSFELTGIGIIILSLYAPRGDTR